MKARKHTEEQIIAVLREGEAGAKVADQALDNQALKITLKKLLTPEVKRLAVSHVRELLGLIDNIDKDSKLVNNPHY